MKKCISTGKKSTIIALTIQEQTTTFIFLRSCINHLKKVKEMGQSESSINVWQKQIDDLTNQYNKCSRKLERFARIRRIKN